MFSKVFGMRWSVAAMALVLAVVALLELRPGREPSVAAGHSPAHRDPSPKAQDSDAELAVLGPLILERNESLNPAEIAPSDDVGAEVVGVGEDVDLFSPSSDGAIVEMLGHKCRVIWNGDERQLHYLEGGLFSRGAFINREKVGLHEHWHPNGALGSLGHYVGGRPHGPFENYDKKGNPQRIGHYSDGVKDGQWTAFWGPGRKRWEGSIVAGLRHGPWTFYDWETGAVDPDKSGIYVEGELVGDEGR